MDRFTLKRADLRSYQEWVAEEIINRRTVLLAIDMSLGKTVSTLTAIRDLFRRKKINHVLVVGTLNVAEKVWGPEILKWEHTKHLTFEVATGLPGQRRRAINKMARITMINRENFPWLWKGFKARNTPWPYEVVVWDDAGSLKEWRHRTSGTKAQPHKHNLTRFGSMARARPFVQYMIIQTGTPSPHGIKDLGGQFFIIDQGERLGKTKEHFLSRWFDRDPYDHSCEPRAGAETEIISRVKDVMIALKAEDYLELPRVIPNPVYVDFPAALMQEYRQFERDTVSLRYDVEAVNKGVLTNKLLQFCNGAMYRGNEDLEIRAPKTVVPVHDLKLKALDYIIEESGSQPIMLGYSFRFDLDRIRRRYPHAVVFNEDKMAYDRWNAGKIELLLIHPASAGHWLNFQFGGHIAVWFGLTNSLELFQQLNARLPRPGQPHPTVTIHRILARGTADDRAIAVLDRRDATQKMLTDAVKTLPGDIP